MMNIEDIKTIMKLMAEYQLTEFSVEADGSNISMRREGSVSAVVQSIPQAVAIPAPVAAPAPAPAASAAPAAAPAPAEAKPKTRRSRKKTEDGEEKKATKTAAPKNTAAKASAAKGAKRTNVGKKM